MNSPHKLRLLRQINGGRPLDWLSGHQCKTVLEMIGDRLITISKAYEAKITKTGERLLGTESRKRKP
jgi:hypothetical protein